MQPQGKTRQDKTKLDDPRRDKIRQKIYNKTKQDIYKIRQGKTTTRQPQDNNKTVQEAKLV